MQDYFQIVRLGLPLIDVRAAIEFNEGHIPSAVNIPILNDQERSAVGTTYKKQGKEKAIALGHELVSGENRERKIQAWIDFIEKNPTTIVTCFRGGLRSQTAQRWLAEQGCDCPRLDGGYKGYRQWVLQQYQNLNENSLISFKVVSGTTGSGKTKLLEDLATSVPTVDLEQRANHRGSAFGGLGEQPSQSDFENVVLSDLLRFLYDEQGQPTSVQSLVIEDESRLIGKRALPPGIFDRIRRSAVVLVEEPVESRAQHIFETYVMGAPDIGAVLEQFVASTRAISKKLGLERAHVISQEIMQCQEMVREFGSLLSVPQVYDQLQVRLQPQAQNSNQARSHAKIKELLQSSCLSWIEKLLVWYYDPMYLGSLERRQPEIEFRGDRKSVTEYLLSCRYQ